MREAGRGRWLTVVLGAALWAAIGAACSGSDESSGTGGAGGSAGNGGEGATTDGGGGSSTGGTGAGGGSAGAGGQYELAGPVTILRDDHAVPHVFADSYAAAFFGAGYAEAQDRHGDVLTEARRVAGRLAEVDPSAVPSDLELRAWKVPEHAEACLEGGTGVRGAPVHEYTRVIAEAYAAGVNRFFSDHPDVAGDAGWTGDEYTAATVVAQLLWKQIADAYAAVGSPIDPLYIEASNQWAALGDHTEGNAAYLLSDGHTPIAPADRTVHLSFIHPDASLNGQRIDAFGRVVGPFTQANTNLASSTSATFPKIAQRFSLEVSGSPGAYRYVARTGPNSTEQVPMTTETVSLRVAGQSEPMESTIHYTRWGPAFRDGDDWTTLYVAARGDCGVADLATFRGPLATSAQRVLDLYGRTGLGNSANVYLDLSSDAAAIVHNAYMVEPPAGVDWTATGGVPAADIPHDWPEAAARYDIDGVAPDVPHIRPGQFDFIQAANDHFRYATIDEAHYDGSYPGVAPVPDFLSGPAGHGSRGRRIVELVKRLSPLSADDARAIALDVCPEQARLFQLALRHATTTGALDPSGLDADVAELLKILTDEWPLSDPGLPRSCANVDSYGMTILALMTYRDATARALVGSLTVDDVTGAPADALAQQLATAAPPALNALAGYMKATYGTLRKAWGEVNLYSRAGEAFGFPGGTEFVQSPVMYYGKESLKAFDPATGTFRVTNGSEHLVFIARDSGSLRVWMLWPNGQLDPAVHPGHPSLTLGARETATLTPWELPLTRDAVAAAPAEPNNGAHPYETQLDYSPAP